MGMAVGDYDHNGRNGFFITTFADDSYTLYRAAGPLHFSDVTAAAGLAQITFPFLGWGAEFLDYDNDGWLDLIAANGHIYPQADTAGWNTSYLQRTLFFRNLLGRRFVDVSGNFGEAIWRPKSSRGLAVG